MHSSNLSAPLILYGRHTPGNHVLTLGLNSPDGSGSIGVVMQFSAGGGGIGFTASASKATGQDAGNSTTYTNSQVAGNSVSIQSGGVLNLKGGVFKGEH